MSSKNGFSKDSLRLENVEAIANDLAARLKNDITSQCRKRGAIVGISGGIDSSVTLALAARAMGPENVVGILMPEKDSSGESKTLALELAAKFGVRTIEEDLTGALEGFGCYQRRDEAVARVFPEYNPKDYQMKIGIKAVNSNLPPVFSVTIIDKNGVNQSKMLPANEYLQIVAASNFKQRCRLSMLYYHADRLYYAVIGTPNKHEVEQGFFVKYGDGGADVMPIAHLYKSQVYQLAAFLGVPQGIIDRVPTTDTYTAEQTQEEFFYQMPYHEMDLVWYGFENNVSPEEVGNVMDKTDEEIKLMYNNFSRRQTSTDYLRMPPIKY
ncbi:MAG TPA: NAD(+) synthase [Ferruginibacter sp.]|nr:NAD(+) synthase [Ferruginibacter sp.]